MKTMCKSFVLILLLTFFSNCNENSNKYERIKSSIHEIDKDTLGKYYQLYIIDKFNQNITKKSFLVFLNDNNVNLKKLLDIPEIHLNESNTYGRNKIPVFKGFYHIGIDGNDDHAAIIFSEKSQDKSGDILIDYNNYFRLTQNTIFSITSSNVKDIGKFNAVKILAKSLNCKNDVKIVVDTTELLSATLKYDNGIFKHSKTLNDKEFQVIRKDSLIQNLTTDHNQFFISFDFRPLSYFYCQ